MKTTPRPLVAPLVLALTACLGDPAFEVEGAGVRGRSCTPHSRYPYLCTNIPEDGLFLLTSYGGPEDDQEEFACGGGAPDGRGWYATSWVRWGCGAKLEIRGGDGCAVVEVLDAGPADWVEREAGMPVLDASPRVCEELFSTSGCGWSDDLAVEVVEVDDRTPLGPTGCRGGRDLDDRRDDDLPDPRDDRPYDESWGSCTSSWGEPGTCVDATDCRRHGGSTERYRCPGPNEIQCCMP